MKRLIFLMILLATAVGVFPKQNLIILNDGSEYHGELEAITEDDVMFSSGEKQMRFSKSEVYMVTFVKERMFQNIKTLSEIENKDIRKALKRLENCKLEVDDDTVVALDKVVYNYKDGVVTKTGTRVFKILTETGKQDAIHTVSYNAKNSSCELEFLISIAADGSVTSVADDAVNDEPLNSSERHYNNMRRIKFGVPKPEVGSVVAYRYSTTYNYDNVRTPIFDVIPMRDVATVLQREYHYNTIPAKLSVEQTKWMLPYKKPSIKKRRGSTRIVMKNIEKVVVDESNIPNGSYILPSVIVSSNVDEIKFASELAADVDDKSFARFLREAKVAKLETVSDIKRVYEYIQQQIVLSQVSLESQQYTPSENKLLFGQKHLSNLDKLALFKTVLKSGSIDSRFLFYSPRYEYKRSVYTENPYFYSGALLEFTFDGNRYYVSFADSNLNFGTLPVSCSLATAISVGSKIDILTLPKISSSQNSSTIDYTATIDDSGNLNLAMSSKTTGYDSYSIRGSRFLSRAKRDEYFDSEASSVKVGAFSKDYKILSDLSDNSLPAVVTSTIVANDYLITSGSIAILNLPDFDLSSSSMRVASSEREFPFVQNNSQVVKKNYKIKLPSKYRLNHLPEGKSLKFGEQEFSVEYSYDTETHTVEVNIMIEENAMILPKNNYKKYQKFIRQRMAICNDAILLEEIK